MKTGTTGVAKSVSDSVGQTKAWPTPRSGLGMSIENAGSKPRRMSPVTTAAPSPGWPGMRARPTRPMRGPSNDSPT